VATLHRKPSLSTVAVAVAALSACGGGPASRVEQASSQPESVAAVTTLDAGNPVASEVVRAPENERRILEYIPSTYGFVVHLSLNKLEASQLFNRHESMLLGSLETQRQTVIKNCHFDPLLDIETITLAIDLRNGNSPEVLFALSTALGATRLEECVVALGGNVSEGAYDVGGDTMSFYWPTEDVLLLSDKKSSDDMMLELRAGRSLDNPQLMEVLSRTDRLATMWGAGTISNAVAANLSVLGVVPKSFVVRGSVWAGVDLTLELSFATDKDANGMMNMIKMGLGNSSGQASPFRELIEAIDVEQFGTLIRLEAQLSPELSGELLKELQ